MSAIPAARNVIQVEEVQFSAAVSESVGNRMGASINSMLNQTINFDWNINGDYTLLTPGSGIDFDGFRRAEYDLIIVDATMFGDGNPFTGTGQLEIDIQIASPSAFSYGSVFSTRPKINGNAVTLGEAGTIYVGSSFPNTTAPVLSTTVVPAGSLFKATLLQVPGGLSGDLSCGVSLVCIGGGN